MSRGAHEKDPPQELEQFRKLLLEFVRIGIYLKPAQCAQLLGITDRTLRDWESRGEGPPRHILPGGLIRYCRDEVDAWLRTPAGKRHLRRAS
ncbi:MAG TPA: helix-turn-helix domain-containing protein [Rhodothermales bacterium]|nr:helix-turn-helix domain-containing protein [Rhodothermales bacterium]